MPFPVAAAAIIVTALVLTGCSPAPEDDWNTRLTPEWTVNATLMSQPVIADDSVLAYVHVSPDSEAIVAWNRANGKELWRSHALPARTAPGVDQFVAVIEKDGSWQVAYLAPRAVGDPVNAWMRLVVADARSGKDLLPQLQDAPIWTRRPEACKDSSTFCLEGFREGDEHTDRELVLADGGIVPDTDPDAGFSTNGFLVASHVSLSHDEVTTVRYGTNGEYAWWRSYEDIFGQGTDYTGGWAWHDEDEKLPVIGWGGQAAPKVTSYPASDVRDLTAGTTVALDRKTGRTLWSQKSTRSCTFSGRGVAPRAEGIMVLCRYRSGSLQRHFEEEGAPPQLVYKDVDLDVIGVDAASGEVVWTVRLGDEPRNYAYQEQPKAPWSDSEEHVIVTANGRRTLLDVRDGSRRELARDVLTPCRPHDTQVVLDSVWKNVRYAASQNMALCNEQGPVKSGTAPSPAALALAGLDIHDDVALVFNGRLAYFRRPAPARPATTTPGTPPPTSAG
ncbi:PQQ-binding-like beta-propeller repeat protein [Microbacterium sp. ASV81]|uniref:outer membrane protein assembly factor BamB family protein n=1 Tax=Microbacterium capsulatum TaxID=3041921 RepID=UPI0028054837|nr:PQQ-binding-like beta-propeller repeat protein [Microbacterium sp. ASV81]